MNNGSDPSMLVALSDATGHHQATSETLKIGIRLHGNQTF